MSRSGPQALAADELVRLERYRFERDRRLYLATRVLVRTVLSKYESVAATDWVFSANGYGRPAIVGAGKWLKFNLSNAHGLVVCALAREIAVGVDVQETEENSPLEVADHFFAHAEVKALQALPAGERSARFFDYWTVKESYIKARGMGLALPLDRFAFSVETGRPPRIAIDPTLADEGSKWQFGSSGPPPLISCRCAPSASTRSTPRSCCAGNHCSRIEPLLREVAHRRSEPTQGLPGDVAPVIRFGTISGWRVTDEVLSLEWRQIDFKAGEVRVDAHTTKNDDGRAFPMTADVRTSAAFL